MYRPLKWIASAKKELKALPEDIQDTFGFALYLAQIGDKHADAKPLKSFGSAGVLEIVESDQDGTYRAVYTVRFRKAVYVLHCFQKKSTRGIVTSRQNMNCIRERLQAAEQDAQENGYA